MALNKHVLQKWDNMRQLHTGRKVHTTTISNLSTSSLNNYYFTTTLQFKCQRNSLIFWSRMPSWKLLNICNNISLRVSLYLHNLILAVDDTYMFTYMKYLYKWRARTRNSSHIIKRIVFFDTINYLRVTLCYQEKFRRILGFTETCRVLLVVLLNGEKRRFQFSLTTAWHEIMSRVVPSCGMCLASSLLTWKH